MRFKRASALLLCLVPIAFAWMPSAAIACGHDGVYAGLGYTQMFMYTSENRLGSNQKITFSPGMGGNAVVGYDFCGSRWGIQLPFEFARQKLNHLEWVNQFNLSLEGVVHLAEWANGIDLRLVGGAGWSYLSEGKYDDRTSGTGIIAHFGPGFAYYFSRTEKVSAALVAEIPFRMVHYFRDRLSSNGTTIFAVPIRISLQVGF